MAAAAAAAAAASAAGNASLAQWGPAAAPQPLQPLGPPLPLSRLALEHVLGPVGGLEERLDFYLWRWWAEGGDPRTSRLPLMAGGPWKLLWATLVYLWLVKRALPRLMAHRKPLELKWTIRAYNLLMVASNVFAFYHGARILQLGRKCFGCQVIQHQDYSNQAVELLHYGWLFFLSRLVEWLDTVFFVLRKKQRQVSKLHVFHHSFVPLLCWTYLKFHPGYSVAFFPLINTFVHSVMYTYYLLATFGAPLQAWLWWKKHLTSLQILQFVLILLQLASIAATLDERCQYPRGFLLVAVAGAALFLWLFYSYYLDTYQRARLARGAAAAAKPAAGGQREGSSAALAEAIDDAICEPEQAKKLA